MSAIKDKLARAWAADLQERVPAGHQVYAMRRDAAAAPPFSVVTVMRMKQAAPGSDAWLAEVRMVCVCDKDQGGSAEQEARLGELYEAIEATVPGVDVDAGVRLCGFSVDEVESAKAEKVYSDVVFITAGVERG
jgi:hypothetical protein